MTTWLNTSIRTQFRTIDGLSIRFAESEDRDDHALLLSPWPESLLAFEPTWARLAEHTHLVAIDLPGFGHSEIQTPVEIISGRRDTAVPPVNGEFLHERLPKSKLDIIDAGHFTWEDAADEYAALVMSWWGGGYATSPSLLDRTAAARNKEEKT